MEINSYGAYVEDLRDIEDADDFVMGVDLSGQRILVDKEFIVAAYKIITQGESK